MFTKSVWINRRTPGWEGKQIRYRKLVLNCFLVSGLGVFDLWADFREQFGSEETRGLDLIAL